MAVSIFHIGLPLDHPSIPVEERPKIRERLSDLQERMTRAGYKYEIIYASPETGLDSFKHRLRTQPCDGVLIGGRISNFPITPSEQSGLAFGCGHGRFAWYLQASESWAESAIN